MKAEALTNSTIELPAAQIAVELPNGETVAATGFIVRSDERGERVIILKAGKKPVTVRNA